VVIIAAMLVDVSLPLVGWFNVPLKVGRSIYFFCGLFVVSCRQELEQITRRTHRAGISGGLKRSMGNMDYTLLSGKDKEDTLEPREERTVKKSTNGTSSFISIFCC